MASSVPVQNYDKRGVKNERINNKRSRRKKKSRKSQL